MRSVQGTTEHPGRLETQTPKQQRLVQLLNTTALGRRRD